MRILSVLYGGVMVIRSRLYEKGVFQSKSLPCRVISIGNLIAGGTGKTPMTIFVAQMLKDSGYRVVVLSRGYHGKMEDAGGIVSDGRTIFKGPVDAGDEPYLIARVLKDVPVLVGRKKYETGMLAVKRFQPEVILLDDAFQHIRLQRDLNLVLLDSRFPFANGYLLPRGLLREPVSALNRANAIIFTRSHHAFNSSTLDRLPQRRPVFYTHHAPVIRKTNPVHGTFLTDTVDLSFLKDKKAMAFAGLADNQQFFDSLEQAGCMLAHTSSFSDHHRYDRSELDRIAETAKGVGARVLVTTLKDYVKIEKKIRWPMELVAVDVQILFIGDENRFLSFISGTPSTSDASGY